MSVMRQNRDRGAHLPEVPRIRCVPEGSRCKGNAAMEIGRPIGRDSGTGPTGRGQRQRLPRAPPQRDRWPYLLDGPDMSVTARDE